MAAAIRATDTILIAAAPREVWRVLTDFGRYQAWWPGNVPVRALQTPPELVGAELEIRPRGGPPFRCRLERLVAEEELVFRYCAGPYQGTGTWRLAWTGGGTAVSYTADLTSDQWLLRFFSRLTDLGRAHSRLMRPVLAGLRRTVSGRPKRRGGWPSEELI